MTDTVARRIFLQNKLWRDKLVTMREQEGSHINWRLLSDAEFEEKLRIKLLEEAEEVQSAQSRTELIVELADVCEVIDSLLRLHGLTKQDILDAQAHKRERLGGFEGRRFVETAEHLPGSGGERYCLANPDKYKEIV